jgi:AcrR family transcriptional regulator
MGRPAYQRARQPEQKAERRAQLLDAARALLGATDESPTQLSLTELAREAGMAKSNTYRYFESREALLLALLLDEWELWVASVLEGLPRVGPGDEPLARFLVHTVAARPILCRLNAVMAAVLEHNVSVETITAFKLGGAALTGRLCEALAAARPEHSLQQYLELSSFVVPMLAGLWPLAHPAPAVEEARQHPELSRFRHDLEAEMTRFTLLLLRGLGPAPGANP